MKRDCPRQAKKETSLSDTSREFTRKDIFLTWMRTSTAMSLGFNPHRPQRVHNLPGAVHSQFVPGSRRLRPAPPFSRPSTSSLPALSEESRPLTSLKSGSAPMLSRRMQYLEEAFKKSTSLSEQFRSVKDDVQAGIQGLYEQVQTVYGIASEDVELHDGTVLSKGSYLCLCYPQRQEEGKVYMDLKRVDPDTASLNLCEVCIYDPSSTPSRKVSNFSLVPIASTPP